jgi:hypothetical protein
MAVTRERFDQGLTYQQYKDQMTRNKERFEANEAGFVPAEADVAAIQSAGPLNVVAIGEDWCGDVIDNFPVLGNLAAAAGNLNVRVYLRDQNLDVMDQYLNDGKHRSIPVFVFFDQDMNEKGVFIERPSSVSQRRDAWRADFFAKNPDLGAPNQSVTEMSAETRQKLMDAMADVRAEWKPTDNAEVVAAIRQAIGV